MLADLLLGYAAYAPGTFVIKALVAVLAASLYRTFREKAGVTASVLIAGAAAECWMIAGYFGYESFILGYGPAAAAGMMALPGPKSINRSICFLKQSQLCWMVSTVSI